MPTVDTLEAIELYGSCVIGYIELHDPDVDRELTLDLIAERFQDPDEEKTLEVAMRLASRGLQLFVEVETDIVGKLIWLHIPRDDPGAIAYFEENISVRQVS